MATDVTAQESIPSAGGAEPEAPTDRREAGRTVMIRPPRGGGRLRLVVLAICAAISALLYLLLIAVLPWLGPAEHSYAGQLFPRINQLLGGSLLEARVYFDSRTVEYWELHTAGAARYLALLLGLFVAYGVALAAVAGRRSPRLAGVAFGAGAGFLLLQVFSPTTLSSDVFSYVIYGRMFLSGGDPYVEVPLQYPDDPFLPLVYWKEVPSFYGPLWTLIAALLASVGGEQVGLTVLLFRLVAIGATLLAAGLIWACLNRAAPHRASQGMVLFLWNPLVVLESGLSAHNDALMAALVVLAVWLYLGRRRALALVALSLSALIKFVTVPLLPLFVLLVLRRLPGFWGRMRFLVAGLVGVGLCTAAVLSLARSGPAVLAVGSLGSSADRYQNNVHELLFEELRTMFGQEPEWAGVPVQFAPWWAMTHTSTEFWSENEPVGQLPQWSPCLVLAPQAAAWLRVYDARSRQIGYIRADAAGPLDRPPEPIHDEVARLQAGPAASPAVVLANALVRLAGWAAFGLVWLVAAWRAAHLRVFLAWSVAVLLAFYWFAAAWIWPWYVIWALAPAALIPRSWLAGLVGALSAGVLTLYVSHGLQNTPDEWVYVYRSLPAFVLPPVLILVSAALWRLLTTLLRVARSTRTFVGRHVTSAPAHPLVILSAAKNQGHTGRVPDSSLRSE